LHIIYIINMIDKQEYRLLEEAEKSKLISQGCAFKEGCIVSVVDDFNPRYVHQVTFSGRVQLGSFKGYFNQPGGIKKHSGVYKATLHNVSVGNDTLIENINNYLANYTIGEGCYIENVDVILVDRVTNFGNGEFVSVMNETGGRELPMHDNLSAHEAYLLALYRHRPLFVDKMYSFVEDYTRSICSDIGYIGDHVTIVDTGYIKNVRIGDYALIEGAGRLKNGSINSEECSPVRIGYGVIADDFIICDGSKVEDGTMLTKCFVGQSCIMGHTYSASNSLFFSNCNEENGEASAIFAGPFTVTHHKSTLLISGMFSFMNAGSGSNQSNHFYKLGPIHQGILERGSKTTSDSYILWPSHIGPFTLIMGRHTKNSDISDFPFSYLIEDGMNSYLVPAINLRSVGTIRDAKKWPRRDNRKGSKLLDNINFNLLSPYTVSKMMKGCEILRELLRTSGENSENYSFQSLRIKNSALKRGIDLYNIAIKKFLGNSLISALEKSDCSSIETIRRDLLKVHHSGGGEWRDLAGLFVPTSEIDRLIEDIENGSICNLSDIYKRFKTLHKDYYEMEWRWAMEQIESYYGIKIDHITIEQITSIILGWRDAVLTLDDMLYEDAKKEFRLTLFHETDKSEKCFETNDFVMAVKEHKRVKSALCDTILKKII
jgi:NDP-sugar pyrophosphorylase family protein